MSGSIRPSKLAGSLAVVVLLVAAACSSDSGSLTTATTGSASVAVSGQLTVFAAASLTESFTAAKATLEGANPGLSITFSFAGSGSLVTQIAQGAPADVIATADTASMQKLVDGGLVEAPVTFARNRLAILVQPGNPKGVKTIADLARRDITFVTEDESVPAGKYAAAMFAGAGVVPNPVSKEPDVKSAVAKVTSGDADATVVYVTDVKAAGAKATGVDIPDAQNQIATYPMAVLKATTHRAAAVAFVATMTAGAGRSALTAAGFLPPS